MPGPAVSEAVATLREVVASGRLAQAYLLVGAPQGDALAAAIDVVSGLFCEAKARPCGACRRCTSVARRTHPDVHWVEPQMKSRQIGVDEMRALEREMMLTSFAGGWRAGVIMDADRMTAQGANAFLKTLEEPPPKCLFLLLTQSPDALPATVRSRCQRVVLSGEFDALPEVWRKQLLDIVSAQDEGTRVGQIAMGSRLLTIFGAMREEVEEAEAASAAQDAREETKETLAARIESRYRGLRTAALKTLTLWYRDILMAVSGIPVARLHFPDRAEAIRRIAAGTTYARALGRLQSISRADAMLASNIPERPVFLSIFQG